MRESKSGRPSSDGKKYKKGHRNADVSGSEHKLATTRTTQFRREVIQNKKVAIAARKQHPQSQHDVVRETGCSSSCNT